MKRVNFLGLYAARKYEPCYVRGPRNLERFRYLRNHISVRFVLMNINTGDSRGLFFSFSALYPPRSSADHRIIKSTFGSAHKSHSRIGERPRGWRIVKENQVYALTFAKSIFSVQQPEYMSAP